MRIINRPLAFVLALVLLAVSVILIVDVIAYALGNAPLIAHWPSWYAWAERTRWKAGVIRFWSVVLIIVGAVLLGLQSKPSRVSRLGVTSEDDATDAAITRRGLSETVRDAATGIDGIASAGVKVTRGKVTVNATAAAHDRTVAAALSDPVTTAVQTSLDRLLLRRAPRVAVRVTPRSS
jgi:hypothetical protein